MNRRAAIVSSCLCLATLLAAAGCSGGAGTSSPSAPAEARASVAEVQVAAPRHGPSGWFFRHVEGLELRDDQRVAVGVIQGQLALDLAPQHDAARLAIGRLADALELGQLDAAKAEEEKAVLSIALGQAKASFSKSINAVHDTLDGPQRAALVADLARQHEGHRGEGASHRHGLAKLAVELGLSEEQRATIAAAWSQGMDELFPARKTRREHAEAKMKAMSDAFLTDDFDAADFDLADHAEEALASGVEIASRGIDVSTRVLSEGQRRLAAGWMRSKAEEL